MAEDNLEAAVQEFLANDLWATSMGITASNISPGEVTAHLTVSAEMVNGHETCHGAVIFALADSAFAMACNSHAHDAVGRTCNIEYLAPASIGDRLRAVAIERARVGRNGIYDIEVRRDGDDALIAEMRGNSREITKR